MLKHSTKTIVSVDAFDIDALVRETYGHDYSFAASRESANDTSHEAGPIDGREPDEFDASDFEKWGQRDYRPYIEPNIDAILNDLHRKGLAPAGDYIIHVSW